MSAADLVHVLEVPTEPVPLILPSACMAEVVGISRFARVPRSPSWSLGAITWRLRPLPVFSYDILAGAAPVTPGPRARIVVLYPLPGREKWEFLGLLVASEPQSRTVDGSEQTAPVPATTPCIATGLRLNDRVVGIPDFEALVKTLYSVR